MMHFAVSEGILAHLAPVLGLRVLIIDDSTFDRRWITRMLHQTGIPMQLVEADTLAAMERALHGPPFDVVFLDCHLPGSTIEMALESLPDNICAPVLITGHAAPHRLQNKGYTLLQKSLISEEVLLSCLMGANLCAPGFEPQDHQVCTAKADTFRTTH